MIGIVDYGMGNLGSIQNMLKKIGVTSKISSEGSELDEADKIILPGVGAFDNGVRNLQQLGLKSWLEKRVLQDRKPLLGICLGMQLLGNSSEEGELPGLGFIAGVVRRFRFDESMSDLKIPHMGWNRIFPKAEIPLVKDLGVEPRFYFVHSFHFCCENEAEAAATTPFGHNFTSIIQKGNIFGVQFHPEKSHKFGMQLLKNFACTC